MVLLFWTGIYILQTSTLVTYQSRALQVSNTGQGSLRFGIEVWDKIEPEEVQRLVESMPRRVSAAIKAKRGYTKY